MNTSSFNSGSSPGSGLQVLVQSLTHLMNNCQFYIDLISHYVAWHAPPLSFGRLKILEKSLLGRSEMFILVGVILLGGVP